MIITIVTDSKAVNQAGRRIANFDRFSRAEARRKMARLIETAQRLGWMVVDERLVLDQEPSLPGEVVWRQE